MENKLSRIVFFNLGGITNPGARYRGYQIARKMEKMGYKTNVFSLFSLTRKNLFLKIVQNILHIFIRISQILKTKKTDRIIIQTAMFPHGPPFFEIILKKIMKRKVFFDINDAIFIPYPKKTEIQIKISDGVIAGNNFLKDYALKYNKNVVVIPTSVDLDALKDIKRTEKNSNVVVGWVGTPSTLKFLEILKEPLGNIGRKFKNIEFRIIGANEFKEIVPKFENIKVILIDWELDKDWRDIANFDIGVMPLYDDIASKGKCAWKALQYMAIGIPSISSDVGAIKDVIKSSKES